MNRLIRAFSPEETGDDTVDIHIDDRLGTCIVKGRFGAALGYNYTTCHHGLTIFATAPRGAEESAEQQLADDAQRLATTKTIADVERSRGKPPAIATDYYTLMAWVKNYMTVLLILFGKSCPLLQDYERIRNTLVLVKRRNGIYFSRSNVINLIWRLFTESRSFFSTMTNEKDLDSNILPITNLGSTAAIIANCQPIRGDDLPLALMPTKLPGRGKGDRDGTRNDKQMGQAAGRYNMTQQKGNGQQEKNGRKDESQRQVIFGPQFYHPMIRQAMLPVLEKI